MKTVIQVFKTKYANSNTGYHGIGDMLRSTLGLFYLSKKYNFKLIVDYSLHPIHMFLEQPAHEFSSIIHKNKESIFVICSQKEIMDYILKSDASVLYFCGWLSLEVYNWPITEEARHFMKNLLCPNTILTNYMNTTQLPFSEYSILHYRIGDDAIGTNTKRQFSLNHIQCRFKKNDILLSDSSDFKEFVATSNLGIYMFHHDICHLGISEDYTSVQNTLFELLLVSKAKSIKSYTMYSWISGFVKIISVIYDIPIVSEINCIF